MVFSNFTAKVKNIMLMNKPLKNVEKGVLTVAPGAKIPTTREPNVILELSKKKSDTTLDLSFNIIKDKFTTANTSCQAVSSHVILPRRQVPCNHKRRLPIL